MSATQNVAARGWLSKGWQELNNSLRKILDRTWVTDQTKTEAQESRSDGCVAKNPHTEDRFLWRADKDEPVLRIQFQQAEAGSVTEIIVTYGWQGIQKVDVTGPMLRNTVIINQPNMGAVVLDMIKQLAVKFKTAKRPHTGAERNAS